jgi:hypothetical protein
MTRPSLLTLTWDNSSVEEVPLATPLLILTALKDLIDASTYWDVESSSLAGSFYYVEIKPKSAVVGVTDQRIVYAANGSSTFSANSMGPGTTATTPSNVPPNDDIICLYAPEGGTGAKIASFPDGDGTSNEIYGPGFRVVGYYGVAENAFATQTWQLWLIESAEILAVATVNTAISQTQGGCHGPMWIGASTAGDDVDVTDRIYGGCWFGDQWDDNWWTNDNVWSDQFASSSINVRRAICFDPAVPAQLLGLKMLTPTKQEPNDFNLVSGAGTYVATDAEYYAYDTKGAGTLVPDKYLGTLRQMRMGRNFPSRVTIQDGASATVAIVWGAHPTTSQDAMWFTNS